jgi:hypothetical protein
MLLYGEYFIQISSPPSSPTPGSSTPIRSRQRCRDRPSPRSDRLGTPENPAVRFTRESYFSAHEGLWNGLTPAGYKLVRCEGAGLQGGMGERRTLRKGLALDRNETIAQRNPGVLR